MSFPIVSLFHLLNHCFNSSGIGGSARFSTSISPSASALDDDVVLSPLRVLVGEVFAKLRAAALFSQQRSAGNCFRHDQQVAEIDRRVPAVVVLAIAGDPRPLRPRRAIAAIASSACCISASTRTMPTRSCMVSCRSY